MANVFKAPETVTVRNAGDVCGQILEAVRQGGDLDIDMAALAEVDLSFVQLVLAARAHLAREGGRLGLVQPAGAALTALLDRAGFLGDPQPADLAFWFHGAPRP